MTFSVDEPLLTIKIEETDGLRRNKEPLAFGVPFPAGALSAQDSLILFLRGEGIAPCVTTPLARWKDGTIKWLLFDTQISMEANSGAVLEIHRRPPGFIDEQASPSFGEDSSDLKLFETPDGISAHCAGFEFHFGPLTFLSFKHNGISGGKPASATSQISIVDKNGEASRLQVDGHWLERKNPLRIVLGLKGHLGIEAGHRSLDFQSRIHFFRDNPAVRMDITLRNPCAAKHPGGVWDLGDEGSVLFRSLKLAFTGLNGGDDGCGYSLEPGGGGQGVHRQLLIHQDSSGGENWSSHNHLNRYGKISTTYRGYKVYGDGQLTIEGLRATPTVAVPTGEHAFTLSIPYFWENFPKSIEYKNGELDIGLFPESSCSTGCFELQGGEQKTHCVYFQLNQGAPEPDSLAWAHHPLTPVIPAEWLHASGACPRLAPLECTSADHFFQSCQEMVDVAVSGPKSFFARREIIDEFGWRNFGDLYADHEAVFHTGNKEFVSHYNNQYDAVKGALAQFMRTGKTAWFRLAGEMASHVADIDIYHTDEDRWQFNHGLFWHTDHHLDAATSTHRTSSREHYKTKDPRLVGGGPAYAHNYATGLLYLYWMTGETRFRESVLELAEFVVRGLQGPDTILETGVLGARRLIRLFKRACNGTGPVEPEVYEFDGPGRASGNALNTLLDACLASDDDKYLKWAEVLIDRCVSTDDEIESMDLLNAEYRWMYTIFLQALGRCLDIKKMAGGLDECFWRWRSVLLKYAIWMVENEYPYLEKPEILEFPNETWAAQDIRKSDVLAHAAIYAPEPLRKRFFERSRFFFESSITQLQSFPTKNLTRPIVILMTNGMTHMDAFTNPVIDESIASRSIHFGAPCPSPYPARRQTSEGSMPSLSHLVDLIKNASLRKELDWAALRLKK